MTSRVKRILQILIYLVNRTISGSIRFRKDSIDFNQEKRLVLDSLIQQGFDQVYHLAKPPSTGVRLRKKVDRSAFFSSLVQNFAYIKTAITHNPNNILSAGTIKMNYFRVPKAASTSILQLLVSKELSIEPEKLSQKQIDILGDLLFQNKLKSHTAHFQNIAIVRNPLSRLHAVYRTIFQGSPKDFIYESYLFGLFTRDMDFDRFVNAVTKIPPTIADYHFRPQYELIYNHQCVRKIKIFKMEEIDTVLNSYLMANFDFTLAHLNKGHSNKEILDNIYSLETARKVYTYYHRDFTYFNYAKDYNDLIMNLSGKSQ